MFKRIVTILTALSLLAALLLAPVGVQADDNRIQPKDAQSVRLQVAVWADPQVSHIFKKRLPFVLSAAKDLRENRVGDIDALVMAGDITENCLPEEWFKVSNAIKDIGVKNYLAATGNHDVRLHDYGIVEDSFTDFTNHLNMAAGSDLLIEQLHYSYEINGYRFIVLGSELATLEEAELCEAQLKWLDRQLAKSNKVGKPSFVIVHQPLKNTHGLPKTWGSIIKTAGTVGPQSDKLQAILNKYGNVFLITGHLHCGFGEFTYQRVENIYSVNLPALGPDNENGECNDSGCGYMLEVYDNEVCFRARNFDKGVYLPQYDVNVNLNTATAALSKTEYRYNGKVKTPKVIVKDAYGKKIAKKYYTVKYQKGRKKAGTYTVTVTFKGKYKNNGKQTMTFTINK